MKAITATLASIVEVFQKDYLICDNVRMSNKRGL